MTCCDAERRALEDLYYMLSVFFNKIAYAFWGQAVQSIECIKDDIVGASELHWVPMQTHQNWGNVVSSGGPGHQQGRSVLSQVHPTCKGLP